MRNLTDEQVERLRMAAREYRSMGAEIDRLLDLHFMDPGDAVPAMSDAMGFAEKMVEILLDES